MIEAEAIALVEWAAEAAGSVRAVAELLQRVLDEGRIEGAAALELGTKLTESHRNVVEAFRHLLCEVVPDLMEDAQETEAQRRTLAELLRRRNRT